jgi:hypothetical protein
MARTVQIRGGRNAGKSERDKIAAKARRMTSDPAVAAQWREAWARVQERLAAVYEARRPVMKSFEAHHSNEVAREAILRALVNGESIAASEEQSFLAVTANKR